MLDPKENNQRTNHFKDMTPQYSCTFAIAGSLTSLLGAERFTSDFTVVHKNEGKEGLAPSVRLKLKSDCYCLPFVRANIEAPKELTVL